MCPFLEKQSASFLALICSRIRGLRARVGPCTAFSQPQLMAPGSVTVGSR